MVVIALSIMGCRNSEPHTFYEKLEASIHHPWQGLPSRSWAASMESSELQQVPLHRTFWLAGHNTYQHADVGLALQQGIQAIEIDIGDDPQLREDWRVCHTNLLGQCSGAVRGTLRQQLRQVYAFHQSRVGHLPIYLFIDKKNAWSAAGHSPQHFDRLLVDELGPSSLWTPQQFQSSAPSLRWQALHRRWPAASELAGRIVVVLTSAEVSAYGDNSTLSAYVSRRGNASLAFVAPSLRPGESCSDTRSLHGSWQDGEVAGTPGSFVVFYNLRYSEAISQLPECHRHHFMSRIWFGREAQSKETDATFSALIDQAGANFVAIRDHRRPLLDGWHRGHPNGAFLQ